MIRTSFFTCIAIVLSGTHSSHGQEVKQEVKELFNGRDLTGWKGLDGFWSVRAGAIVGQTTPNNPTRGNTFLVWQGGEVRDFEMTCEVKFTGNNSGVQYRSDVVDKDKFVLRGYQADLHPRQDYFGMLYGEKYGKRGIIAKRGQRLVIDKNGAISNESKVGDSAKLVDTTWNKLKIVAVGNRLVHQVNGVTTIDVTDNHKDAKSTGVLGLQLHQGPPMKVEFKNIRLRKLSGKNAQKTLSEVTDD